jgi:ADP-ribosyl-[dinitrogen reductase] hydrolase
MTTPAAADPELVSRARGALLGLVAGNQLGVPTEHLGTPEAIRAAFPSGVRDLSPAPQGSPYDDDPAVALLLAESLVTCGDFDANDVARRWVDWMKSDGRGLGATTRRALRLIEKGMAPFEAGQRAREADPARSASNGAVMRCVSIAIRYHDSPERLTRVSMQQAAMTHSDERCLWGAVAVNLAARELLHGNIYFIDEVLHRLKDGAPRVLLDAIRRVPWEQREELPITRPGETGYVVHCVEIALWFATHARSLEDALVYLAQAGGDTDTNAAVAGALLGAREGETALPPRWLDQIPGRLEIQGLAEELLRIIPSASHRRRSDPSRPDPRA